MSQPLTIRDAVACIKSIENSSAAAPVLPDASAPVVTPLGADVAITYLVDTGTQFELVQMRHLDQIDGRQDKLARIGLRNLMRLAGERLKVRTYNNIYAVFLDGHFEASLTLLDALWDDTLAEMTPNGPVMAMPARDVLAFCDAESTRGIQELKDMIDRVWADGPPDHPISRDLYARRDGRWHRLSGPSRHGRGALSPV